MKQKFFFLMLFMGLMFAGCSDSDDDQNQDEPEVVVPGEDDPQSKTPLYMYILTQGKYNLNNGTLARYSFASEELNNNLFTEVNGRGLGDTANDMDIYGSKIYIMVSTSGTVEVLDASTGESIKQISMLQEDGSSRKPRHIAFHEDKAYVCNYDNTVARIDTLTLEVEDFVEVGRSPEGICVADGKLFVSNSGGADYPDYDNTVSVIDIESFSVVETLEVGVNPGVIKPDGLGNVYVMLVGNYYDIASNFVRINASTYEIEEIGIPVSNFTVANEKAYMYYYDYYSTDGAVYSVYDLESQTLTTNSFITTKGDTDIAVPYGIGVDPVTGNVYIADTINYTDTGDVYCFDADGVFQYKISDIGINPCSFVFYYN